MADETTPSRRTGMDRRTFLRRAAVTGAAAAWATPVVQTITARPAWASAGSPAECHYDTGPWFAGGQQMAASGGCVQACKHSDGCGGDPPGPEANVEPCYTVCAAACPDGARSHDRVCCDGSFCDANNWCILNVGKRRRQACYIGNASCSPVTCATGIL
jgi:hypothetical protein